MGQRFSSSGEEHSGLASSGICDVKCWTRNLVSWISDGAMCSGKLWNENFRFLSKASRGDRKDKASLRLGMAPCMSLTLGAVKVGDLTVLAEPPVAESPAVDSALSSSSRYSMEEI